METETKTIYFGGGCFWCTEAVFSSLKGVVEVKSGYMGGSLPKPSYTQVVSGTTGHVEVVRVAYDPSGISLDDLLSVFFSTHDPTTPDRQGNDVGTQYRSSIFYTEEDQKTSIDRAVERAAQNLAEGKSIITEVRPADTFYPAESYHQHYYQGHPRQPYCQLVIYPKLEKLQKEHREKIKH